LSNTSYRNLLDEELLYRVSQRQDQEAMNMLYKRYAHLAMGVGLKYLPYDEAQDAVQQVFVKIWTDAAQYKVKSFKPWLYTVVKNQCLMVLRKSNPTIAFPENGMDFVEYDDQSHHKMEQEHVLRILEACLEKLQQPQKNCIELFYRAQKTYAEIANMQQLTDKQVKTFLQNGRRNLKICFGNHKQTHL
jgi:RNA polymerase sigma-70 factor (ECF subfamily)